MHRGWVCACLVVSACSGARIAFPEGPSVPAPDAVPHWVQASEACVGARTFSAELQLNGHVGDESLRRVTLQVAMTREGAIRLLAVAPVGAPFFTLAGRTDRATLTLPRERRVLVAPASDIVDALVGLKLRPVDWLNLLTGCVASGQAVDGVRVQDATIVALQDHAARVRIEQEGSTWRIVAGERPDLLVEYPEAQGRWPSVARLTSRRGAPLNVMLTMTIGQVNVNLDIPEKAFVLEVPSDFQPMTLDELRAMGPLSAARSVPSAGGR